MNPLELLHKFKAENSIGPREFEIDSVEEKLHATIDAYKLQRHEDESRLKLLDWILKLTYEQMCELAEMIEDVHPLDRERAVCRVRMGMQPDGSPRLDPNRQPGKLLLENPKVEKDITKDYDWDSEDVVADAAADDMTSLDRGVVLVPSNNGQLPSFRFTRSQ